MTCQNHNDLSFLFSYFTFMLLLGESSFNLIQVYSYNKQLIKSLQKVQVPRQL